MKRKIRLPYKNEGLKEIECEQTLILIGANGSGKTRLGTWIEMQSEETERVHRISAQKSLSMPITATPMSMDQAESGLFFGDPSHGFIHKSSSRWGGNPAIAQLNDFQKLMILLFSDQVEQSSNYLFNSKKSIEKVVPPITKLDIVKSVWEKILPHRELVISGLKIQTSIPERPEIKYDSSEMSDGERVIFYLISQCVSAPKDAIIIIDEPELHLHKSVQAPLWSEIQKTRDDCLFIYLTHDVDFAVSQNSASRIWLKSYDGTSWDWEEIPPLDGMPQNLVIEILGSRKNVVFIEGTHSSFDYQLYRIILENFLVIPLGSCAQVIQNTKAFKSNSQFHHLKVFGIIDRDRRSNEEIEALLHHEIYTLDVAEVENLFCIENVLKFLSVKLARDPLIDFQESSDKIFTFIESEIDTQVSLRVISEVRFCLGNLDEKSQNLYEIQEVFGKLVTSINVESLWREQKLILSDVITRRDYDGLLRLYNRKSICSRISPIFGLKEKELAEQILRYARSDSGKELKQILKPYFGQFSQFIE